MSLPPSTNPNDPHPDEFERLAPTHDSWPSPPASPAASVPGPPSNPYYRSVLDDDPYAPSSLDENPYGPSTLDDDPYAPSSLDSGVVTRAPGPQHAPYLGSSPNSPGTAYGQPTGLVPSHGSAAQGTYPTSTPYQQSAPYGAPSQQRAPGTETGKGLQLWGLILAFLVPLLGLILSLIARGQRRRAGLPFGMAKAGIIVGIIMTALVLAGTITWIVVAVQYAQACSILGPGTHLVEWFTYNC